MTDILENSRFTEMKSIQPYSTKDEYIYAMKEDLSEWFNTMYSTSLTALNFIDKLETGVLICLHANNVTKAALNTHKFNQNDLNQAGIINIPSSSILNPSNTNRVLLTPSGKSSWSGDYLLYKGDAKPQSFQSRDNISNFIKWCRYIAKVRECLMFETDDLILRKNEKNFILCLLEIARFGSKFGIQVPTIIQLEQEIEAEIEREIEQSQKIEPFVIKVVSPKPDVQKEINVYIDDEKLASKNEIQMILSQIGNDLADNKSEISKQLSQTNSLVISVTNEFEDKKLNSNGSFDSSSLDGSFGVDDEESDLEENKKSIYNDSLENFNYIEEKNRQNTSRLPERECKQIESDSRASIQSFSNNKLNQCSPLLPSPLSTSLSSSNSSLFNQHETVSKIDEGLSIVCEEKILEKPIEETKNKVVKNLNSLFNSGIVMTRDKTDKSLENSNINRLNIRSRSISPEVMGNERPKSQEKMTYSLEQNINTKQELISANSQTNLHNHVCSIADRCTCEKQFPVVKIGEGKYRIGNTKNIVFIRILRNHIMVRVGGGWDTLENYLNKHDPCRCPGEASHISSSLRSKHYENNSINEATNCSSNILLTPIHNQNSSSTSQTNSINKIQSSLSQNPFLRYQAKANFSSNKNCNSTTCSTNKPGIDFTDAKLVVERDTQGKHIVGKIIITQSEDSNQSVLNKSISNNSLNNYTTTNNTKQLFNASTNFEMNGQNNKNIVTPIKQNANTYNNDKNNSFTTCTPSNSNFQRQPLSKTCIPTSNSLNSISQNLLKNKMKKIIKQMPPQSPQINRKSQNFVNDNQFTILRNSPGLLKFNRTNTDVSSNPTTTGYNSLNDDSSSDFLDHAPVYTETKLPPRILKKYDKKRAITEAIIDIDKIEQTVTELSSNSALNSPKQIHSNLKVTSSPKPPPRNKKKYRKSKTSDLTRYQMSLDNSTCDSNMNDNEDSLEESDYESSEGIQKKMELEKLNDSLESINLTLNKDNKIEDDSLLLNNDHGISLSLSTTSSISNVNEIEHDHETTNSNGQKNGRALWDKTPQNFDYKTQIPVRSPPKNKIPHSSTMDHIQNKSQSNFLNTSSPRRDSSLSKKARNLNMAKEKLYEMKKSIDAKINLEQLEKPKIPTPASPIVRTTPRKVKKRSGERSMTTGIFLEPELTKTPNVQKVSDAPSTPRTRQNTSLIPKPSPTKLTPNSKQTSSSLHNLTNCLGTTNLSRTRRDSSVASSRTCLSNHNVSFSSTNNTPNEFKENKAYELRKKSTILNKIIVKTQQNDPIYSRSHPISTEMTEQQALNLTLNENIQNYLTHETTVRKRLFAKKNEKSFDPNLSIGSNGSSGFSTNSFPVATNFIQKNKLLAASPMANKVKPIVSMTMYSNKKKESPTKPKPPSRSKSNNDLFYELERTNSAQDLIELLNNCEPPVGDMSKYKILLNECENYDPKLKKTKKLQTSPRKNAKTTMAQISVNTAKNAAKNNKNIVNSCAPNRQGTHKRSRSLPSYQCIPFTNPQNYDTANDDDDEEEYHDETYWQDVKTNF